MPARNRSSDKGPTQRQLRAGELVRHAIVDILAREEFRDPALQGVSVTVSAVRVSPDLKHALVFVEPLGGARAEEVVAGLNRASAFIRGRLGKQIETKFTPNLRFVHDVSFDAASDLNALLSRPEVRRDLEGDAAADSDAED